MKLPVWQQAAALLACLAVPFMAAGLGSWATNQSVHDWYPTLRKPSWTPPGRVIGAVWSVLYTLMGISAWLTWRRAVDGKAARGEADAARTWFLGQLALNTAWSFAFFGLRSPLAGLAVILPLWGSVASWTRAAARVDRLAGALQLPYLGWVSFASVLNAVIWWKNRGG
jgi:tryptophan-rich sensory protein